MKRTAPPNPNVAYKDEAFLESDDARPLRILAEYLGPMRGLRRARICDTVVFFGSARLAVNDPLGRYCDEARELARLVAEWAKAFAPHLHRFVVCTGGGGGIMEAANRGASEAAAATVGLNIGLPQEQRPNPYVPRELSFEFRYFFMRKLWFAHLARALVVFPGGFGTMSELLEILTLAQTEKLARRIPILLYGAAYWKEIINFDALVRHNMISGDDLALFRFVDEPAAAFEVLKAELAVAPEEAVPAFARSRTANSSRA